MRSSPRNDQRAAPHGASVAPLIFLFSSAALAWAYFLYPVALRVIAFLRPSAAIRRRPITPRVSVIIAAHNESRVIERRIRNVWDCDYPSDQLEILVADDGSTDGTDAIVAGLAQQPQTTLLLVRQEEWMGKVKALNAAIARAGGDVIVLTDAPALFDKDTLREIVANFADERVGGATGLFQLMQDETLAQETEGEFWSFKNKLIELEGRVDSTTFATGKLVAFRNGILDQIDDLVADDVNVAMQVRAAGYRMIADPRAACYQMKPSTFAELISRKTTGGVAGGLDQSFRFRRMLFRPRYGLFGLVIFPTRILLTPLSPFLLAAATLSGARLAARVVPKADVALVAAAALVAGLALSPLRALLPRLLLTFLLNQWILFKGLVIWLSGSYDVKWEQAASVRVPLPTNYRPHDDQSASALSERVTRPRSA